MALPIPLQILLYFDPFLAPFAPSLIHKITAPSSLSLSPAVSQQWFLFVNLHCLFSMSQVLTAQQNLILRDFVDSLSAVIKPANISLPSAQFWVFLTLLSCRVMTGSFLLLCWLWRRLAWRTKGSTLAWPSTHLWSRSARVAASASQWCLVGKIFRSARANPLVPHTGQTGETYQPTSPKHKLCSILSSVRQSAPTRPSVWVQIRHHEHLNRAYL